MKTGSSLGLRHQLQLPASRLPARRKKHGASGCSAAWSKLSLNLHLNSGHSVYKHDDQHQPGRGARTARRGFTGVLTMSKQIVVVCTKGCIHVTSQNLQTVFLNDRAEPMGKNIDEGIFKNHMTSYTVTDFWTCYAGAVLQWAATHYIYGQARNPAEGG